MFTATAIRDRIKGQPFVPLRIVMSSGESYEVTHPDFAMVFKNYVIVGTAGRNNPAIPETESRISMLHISDLQDMPEGNGKKSTKSKTAR